MVDYTVTERVKRQREARLREGWQEVRVWVPTVADAEELRSLAAQHRANAENLTELLNSGIAMSTATIERALEAIAAQGSTAYTSPYGAALEFLTELAASADLKGLSKAFMLFARAMPFSAPFISSAVPAKVLNHYLIPRHQLDTDSILAWSNSNSNWGERIISTLRNPEQFEKTVNTIAEEIKLAKAS
jgi:hypothetical protein